MAAAHDRVVNALTQTTGYTPPGGKGNWRCPAHPDNTPSLAVSNGDGRVLINCHAGCPVEAVLAALGLTYVDLYDEPATATRPTRREIAAYPYVDEFGVPLFEVVRYDPKGFGQRRPDGKGGHTWRLGNTRRVLYRLPAIIDAIADGAPIWIVEGEKDVHALEREGEIATTSPGGAGKWQPEYTQTLRGAHVIIVADNDEPGRKHADTVAAALEGVAATIERREPAAGHKDIADHLGAGLGLGQLVNPATAPPADQHAYVINWKELWMQETIDHEWLAEPVLPAGRQVAIFSVAKTGKSLLALEIATALATGRPVLAQPAAPPIHVMYIDMEMTRDDLRERLESLDYGPHSDLEHLHYYQLADFPPLDTHEGGAIVHKLATWHQATLVVIDTMARAVSGDENEADTYRDFYRHTGRHLKASGIALLRLDHAGKDGIKGQRGSSAKDDDVDLVWRLTIDRDLATLHRTRSRIAWAPQTINLTRTDHDGTLRHTVQTDNTYPAGTAEVAALLDQHNIPLDATVRNAMTTLKTHGNGKRQAVVQAALRYRRTQ